LICFYSVIANPKKKKEYSDDTANDTNLKIKPKEEGGMQIPDLDKKIIIK
jgi:hypothetical protein